jgi:hypothetical protein
VFLKHCETISTINVKDVKRKMQEEIREYLELKNSIRKMKPATAGENKQRSGSSKKVSMALPLWNDSLKVKEEVNNQEDRELENKSSKEIPKKILLEGAGSKE